MPGHTRDELTCPKCLQPTVTCEYWWSGFGDSWDIFRHACSNPECGHVEEQLGIPGRFPKESHVDWTRCPFCGRTSAPAEWTPTC
jgi:hypothetical protein